MKRCFIVWLTCGCGLFAMGQEPEPILPVVDTEIAARVGEVSADSIEHYIRTLAAFETRHSLSDTVSDHRGIGAARRWVAAKLRSFKVGDGSTMHVSLDPFEVKPGPRTPRVPRPVVMKNVVARLQGTNPADTRVILITGHLDSRNSDVMDAEGVAPGANDDASGVAVVIELARVLAAHPLPCEVIFMAVQGEEQGLLGARDMAGKLKQQQANLVAVFNNDIVGNTLASETGKRNDRTVRIFSEMIPAYETDEQAAARQALKAENDSPSRQLARYIKMVAEAYLDSFTVTLNARPDRFLRGGDHTPFSQLGFSAVRVTEFHENFMHQHQNVRVEEGNRYGDLPEFVDFPYAANVARVNLAAIASLGKAPGAPESVELKINLGNTTHLQWSAPTSGPPPKGYYVLLRETFEPFWTHRFFVDGTSVALPFSKDNYFFAVQAVGADGHTSVPQMPVPVRDH